MTTKASSIKAEEKDAGTRIDTLLASRFPAYSRSYFQALIANGGVFVNPHTTRGVGVNGKVVEKDYRAHAGDTIKVNFEEPEKPSLEPDPSVPFRVVHDEPDFAVIEKPAGVVVHPSHTHKKGTLVNGLLAKWPEMKGVGDPSTGSGQEILRPGIVHRLDKETSGLMVVAKTQPMFLWLKKQFQEGKVKKRYSALVYGVPKMAQGEIDVPIARMGQKQVAASRMHKGFSGKVGKSRNARTGFKISALYDGFALVEAEPKTGRMHQIRVHLKHLGHPVAGDKKYASRRQLKLLPLKRHFLHAGYLAFLLPDGRKVEFSSPLPADLEQTLEQLKGS